MPFGRGLLTVDVMEEAAGGLLLSEVLLDAQIASSVVIDWMARALVIRAGAVLPGVIHFAISFNAFPVSR